MKILRYLLIAVIVVLVVLYFSRNIIAKRSVEIAVKEMTGFPLEIGSLNIGIFSGTLEVRDLKLMNPSEFQGGTFVNLPGLRVDYDTMSFLRRSPHIKELIVNVAEVVIVKNEKGQTNTAVMQEKAASVSGGGEKQTGGETPSTETVAPKEEKAMHYRVDLVKVHVAGTVIQRTIGRDGKASDRKLNLNVNATYKDISESTSISQLVMNTVFGQLGVQMVEDALKGVGGAGKGLGDSLQKTGQGLFDAFKKK
jgi:hypothetical protein